MTKSAFEAVVKDYFLFMYELFVLYPASLAFNFAAEIFCPDNGLNMFSTSPKKLLLLYK